MDDHTKMDRRRFRWRCIACGHTDIPLAVNAHLNTTVEFPNVFHAAVISFVMASSFLWRWHKCPSCGKREMRFEVNSGR